MRGDRRFSQAISEGDGISLLADVGGKEAARAAAAGGAEGIVVRAELAGLRGATALPILWYAPAAAGDAAPEGADALVIGVSGLEAENGRLEELHRRTLDAGLDCVVAVRDEDQLQLALERVDPDIFLLAAPPGDAGLEHVLGLLPDVPAGKLAVAELEVAGRADVEELERAGVDAVIVPAASLALLVGEPAPEP